MEILSRRQLTLATAERQWLRERQPRSVTDAVTHLVGLQAQLPLEPYVGLWCRLAGFRHPELADLIRDRSLVRILMMRGTLHLLTAADCLALRPVHQGMLRSRMASSLRSRLQGVDLDALAAAAAPIFDEEPRTVTEVGRMVGDRWPQAEPRWLGTMLTGLLPLVQVPPRGVWGEGGVARSLSARAWLGTDPSTTAAPEVLDALVLRYLRAFGPATGSDLRAWCGLTGLPAVVARVRPQLVGYRDEAGRELLDVPGAMVPQDDAALPVRFLPAFDNTVLAFQDRSRVIDDEHRGLSVSGARFVLVDGRVAATWTATVAGFAPPAEVPRAGGKVTVRVQALRALTPSEQDEVASEGSLLASFLGEGAPGRAEISGP